MLRCVGIKLIVEDTCRDIFYAFIVITLDLDDDVQCISDK